MKIIVRQKADPDLDRILVGSPNLNAPCFRPVDCY
jgi:hypothetical protein